MSKGPQVLAPGHRRKRVSAKPSRSEAPFPLGDYMIPAADPLGRSVRLSVTASPNARRVCSTLLARNLFGFQTEEDVLRWCVNHGLMELSKRSKDREVISDVSAMNTVVRAAAIQLEYASYDNVFRGIAAAIDVLISDGHYAKAEELADLAWRELDKVGDPYWRPMFREMAKKKLDEAKKAVGVAKGNGKGR